MKQDGKAKKLAVSGWTGWLLGRIKTAGRGQPRLELLERIALAPRQSLSLVEAEGRRFLVATSPEGSPAFYALDERPRLVGKSVGRRAAAARPTARLSW